MYINTHQHTHTQTHTQPYPHKRTRSPRDTERRANVDVVVVFVAKARCDAAKTVCGTGVALWRSHSSHPAPPCTYARCLKLFMGTPVRRHECACVPNACAYHYTKRDVRGWIHALRVYSLVGSFTRLTGVYVFASKVNWSAVHIILK